MNTVWPHPCLPAPAGASASPADGPAPADPPGPPAPPDAGLPPAVARLFRRTLAEGRIHPLMPLLLRYRREPRP